MVWLALALYLLGILPAFLLEEEHKSAARALARALFWPFISAGALVVVSALALGELGRRFARWS